MNWGAIEQRAAEIVSHAERLRNNNADITGAPRRYMSLPELEGWCIALYSYIEQYPRSDENWAGWLAYVIWTTPNPVTKEKKARKTKRK